MTANPWNPLDWFQSAQDWFIKSEKSSGFRPYLIFLILCFGLAIYLLTLHNENKLILYTAIGLIGISSLGFMILYIIKSFQEPDFCRSEIHIQRMKKIDIEMLGTESQQFQAEVVEREMIEQAVQETNALKKPSEQDIKK